MKERKGRKSNRWNFEPVGGESMAGRCNEIASALSALSPHSIVVTHSVVLAHYSSPAWWSRKRNSCPGCFSSRKGLVYWDSALLHRQG